MTTIRVFEFVQSTTVQTFPEDLIGKFFFVKGALAQQRLQCTKVSVSQSGTVRVSWGNDYFYKLSEVEFETDFYEAKENN